MIGPQLPARNFPPKSLICKVNKPAAVVVNTGLQSLVPYPEERDSPEREVSLIVTNRYNVLLLLTYDTAY